MSYSAASNIARYGDFMSSPGSADYELVNSLATVRNKTRNLARNSGTMKRYLQLLRDNVVGENGFTLQLSSSKTEDAFKQWCEAPTVDGKMTMVDLCNQMVGSWGRDGEVIIEIVKNSKYPDMIALNPLEADMLDETLTTNTRDGNQIKMGVEIDQYGRPIAYHMLTSHPGDLHSSAPFPKTRHRRVPADRIIHIFERLRAGQTRGEPPAAAIINNVKMTDGYREAETMNRRLAASTMGFFTTGAATSGGIDALATDAEPDRYGDERLIMDVEPGTLKELPPGMTFSKFDPGGSQTDYAQFESQVKKDTAMGLGISTFALGMETAGVSYSTGRSVIQEDRDFYKVMQAFFIRQGLRPIFRAWAAMHMLTPNSTIPPTKYLAMVSIVKFRGRGWTWIDPAKDIKANAEALDTLQTSYSQIAATRGMDVTELFEEIAKDREIMKSFGLTPVPLTGKPDVESGTPDDIEE